MKCIMSRLLEICHTHPARGALAPPFIVGCLLNLFDSEFNTCGQAVGAALVKSSHLHFGVGGKLGVIYTVIVYPCALADVDRLSHDVVAGNRLTRMSRTRERLSAREIRLGVDVGATDADVKMQVISARIARQAHVTYYLSRFDLVAVIDRYRAFFEVLKTQHNTVAAVHLDIVAHAVKPRVGGLPREIVSAGYDTPRKRAEDIISVVGGVALYIYTLVPVAYSVACGVGICTASEVGIDIMVFALKERVFAVKDAVGCHAQSSPFSMMLAILPFLSISDKMSRASSTRAEKRLNVMKVDSFGKRAIN